MSPYFTQNSLEVSPKVTEICSKISQNFSRPPLGNLVSLPGVWPRLPGNVPVFYPKFLESFIQSYRNLLENFPKFFSTTLRKFSLSLLGVWPRLRPCEHKKRKLIYPVLFKLHIHVSGNLLRITRRVDVEAEDEVSSTAVESNSSRILVL